MASKWDPWIRANWAALVRGEYLTIPQQGMCEPACHPEDFTAGIGWPLGQTCDYMLPFDDGSRVHVQCFKDQHGRPVYRVHRDRWDPGYSVEHAINHLLHETPVRKLW